MFYKGTSKSPLLFELVLRLHQVQMKGELILQCVNLSGTRMIEVLIVGLYRGNNLEMVVRGLNSLKLVPLVKGATEI